MADTILGYKVASAEEQRRTAVVFLGATILVIVLGIGGYIGFNLFQQTGRLQAVATVTQNVALCKYRVRRFSRRARYRDLTDFIDCAEARRLNRAEDRFGGEVLQMNFAELSFATQDGQHVVSKLRDTGRAPFEIGQQVEILYDVDNPFARVRLFRDTPLGFGKTSIAPNAASPAAEVESVTEMEPTVRQPRPSDSVSESTKKWIGLAAVLLLVALMIWIVRRVFRMIRRLLGSSASTGSGTKRTKRRSSHPVPGISTDRLARATQRQFG